MYKTLVPGTIPVPELHQYLLGSINPRPIAFVATVGADGSHNLSPFSFFNVFSANPPIVVFSPARRGRDNTTKHTYENLKLNGECTVNIVNYNMVHQMVLSSTEYEQGEDEFVRAGFTKIASENVAPPRVAESPSQMECRVRDIINYGELAGGGNLIIAEVVKMHVKEDILDENGKIDQLKIDTVGRCGKNYYSRPSASLFTIDNPKGTDNIGYNGLPEFIKNSPILSGNDLGQLGKISEMPSQESIKELVSKNPDLNTILSENGSDHRLHTFAKKLIAEGKVESALKVLLAKN
ncbi:MAG: flavin reductase family protein [Bacteroidetes bacterium]|nr:flavin reductase family protein [Bacteroidota bacterium]